MRHAPSKLFATISVERKFTYAVAERDRRQWTEMIFYEAGGLIKNHLPRSFKSLT